MKTLISKVYFGKKVLHKKAADIFFSKKTSGFKKFSLKIFNMENNTQEVNTYCLKKSFSLKKKNVIQNRIL